MPATHWTRTVLGMLCLLAAPLAADWEASLKPPDVNKSGLPPYPGDDSEWLAAAANMLAAARYGHGATMQERAGDIYQELVAWNGGLGGTGYAKDALDYWLGSSHNQWLANPYTITGELGDRTPAGWAEPDGLGYLGNLLRDGSHVSLALAESPAATSLHAVTMVGDSGTAGGYGPGQNPNAVGVTDADRGTGADRYDASWNAAESRWDVDYWSGAGHLAQATTLEPDRFFRWTQPLTDNAYLGIVSPKRIDGNLRNYWVYLVRSTYEGSTVYAIDFTITGDLEQIKHDGEWTPTMAEADELGEDVCRDSHFLFRDGDALVVPSVLAESTTCMSVAVGFGRISDPGWAAYQPLAEIVSPAGKWFTIEGEFGTGEGTGGTLLFEPFPPVFAPEPATALLLAGGAGACLIRRRRRSRSR